MTIFKRVPFLAIIILLTSCADRIFCNDSSKYLKKIRPNKPYKIEGVYCIESDIINNHGSSNVTLKIYDRITGAVIDQGTVFFGELSKATIDAGIVEMGISNGTIDIWVEVPDHLSFVIEDLVLDNRKIVVNCYIGSSRQF